MSNMYNGQIKLLITILENSFEMRHAAKQQYSKVIYETTVSLQTLNSCQVFESMLVPSLVAAVVHWVVNVRLRPFVVVSALHGFDLAHP